MSLLDFAMARELISSDLSDDAFQEVIDLEEAWLARRIGQLEGVRTERFINVRYLQTIRLRRPTAMDDMFVVVDNGVDVTSQVELRWDGWRVARLEDVGWNAYAITDSEVEVTYEPNDLLEVQRALMSLVRLTASASTIATGITSETIGSYSYTLGTGAEAPRNIRASVLRSLREPSAPFTSRIRSSIIPEPLGIT